MDLGKYAAPVLAAWAISLVLLAALIARSLLRNAAARRALETEEARLHQAAQSKGRRNG